jgi:hypothetical protein
VKALGLIAMFAACNFQATRVDNPAVDASAADPADASAPVDASAIDTPAPPLDTQFCLGAGLVRVCFAAPPTGNLNLPLGGALDTTASANCNLVVGQQAGPQLCVLAAANVTVAGNFVAVGARPLVLFATDTIAVTAGGAIDVSSASGIGARTGAGGNATECSRSDGGQNDSGGAGGGAGGSFGTAGGRGGTGDLNDNTPSGHGLGGSPGNVQLTPTVLHGGCRGGSGGDGNGGGGSGGVGGEGGGAVYLIAGTRITIDLNGSVFASGAGGRVTAGSAGQEEGAGGGGSGGMIVFDAPSMQINGRVVANGGAGGGGGGNVGGTPGGNGSTMLWNQRAPAGIGDPAPPTGPAGNGAEGTATGQSSNVDGASSDLGGGGGGGGLGVVWTYGTLNGGSLMSPAPVQR